MTSKPPLPQHHLLNSPSTLRIYQLQQTTEYGGKVVVCCSLGCIDPRRFMLLEPRICVCMSLTQLLKQCIKEISLGLGVPAALHLCLHDDCSALWCSPTTDNLKWLRSIRRLVHDSLQLTYYGR